MYWLSGYCVVAWLISLWVVRHDDLADAAHDDELELSPGTQRVVHVLTILAAPLWLPFGLVCLYRAAVDTWRIMRFSQTYTEPELTPVNSLTLEQSVQDWFTEETRALFPFNYRLVTDCIYRSEPIRVVNRYLLSDDQKSIAVLSVGTDAFDHEEEQLRYYAILSVNEDGTYFETCNADEDLYEALPEPEDGVVLTIPGEIDFAELLGHHQLAVETAGAPLLAWSPDQILEVSRYGYRKVKAWEHRIGKINVAPPEAVLPTAPESPQEEREPAAADLVPAL